MASRKPSVEPDLARQYGNVLKRVNDAVLALDRNGHFTYVNRQAAVLLGRNPEDLLGRDARMEYPEVEQPFRRILDEAMAARASIRMETYWEPQNRWFESSIYPSADGVAIFILEITDRKQAEQDQNHVLDLILHEAELDETLDLLARTVEAECPGMLCSILLLDPDGVHVRHVAAPSLPENYNRAFDGQPIAAAFRGDSVVSEDIATDPRWKAHRDAALKHGLRACWSTPIFDAQWRVLGAFACYFRKPARPDERHWNLIEIAAHTAAIAIVKHAKENAQRAREERLRLALRHGKTGTWEWDIPGKRLIWSDELKAIFGWPPETEPTMEKTLGAIYPEDRSIFESAIQSLRTQPAVGYDIEYRITWPDGSLHWIAGKGRTDFDADGRPVLVMGVAQDITERKHAEEEIARREAQLAEAQRVAHLGSFEWDIRNGRLYRSEELCRILGMSLEGIEPAFEDYLVRLHPGDRSAARKIAVRAYREHKNFDFEARILRPDGAVRTLRIQGRWIFEIEQDPVRLVGICQDITERKQAEDQLRQSEERFQVAARATNDMIWDWDLATDAVWWSQGATLLFKYPAGDVRADLDWWSEHIHPADRERVVSGIRTAAGRGEQFWSDEYRFQRADGSHADVFDRGYVVCDSTGKPIRMVGAMADITERKRALENLERGVAVRTAELQNEIGHRRRAEEQLRARNEELKSFAYTVSHDLKAPLRGIAGYAQELDHRHRSGLSDRALFCLSQILAATKNLDRLIEDLLHYSRLDAATPTSTEVNPAAMVEGILAARKPMLLEQGAEVTVDLPSTTIRIWERALLQVLTNLIDNALKYSRNAKPPRIRITGQQNPDTFRIAVSDNGIGFDMKYHDRIFGLFNRLVRQDEFEGTGAGLAIAKKLVDKLGGQIRAESKPGAGATFFLELPVKPSGAGETG
jgi:PAS domain S-box-containing protein